MQSCPFGVPSSSAVVYGAALKCTDLAICLRLRRCRALPRPLAGPYNGVSNGRVCRLACSTGVSTEDPLIGAKFLPIGLCRAPDGLPILPRRPLPRVGGTSCPTYVSALDGACSITHFRSLIGPNEHLEKFLDFVWKFLSVPPTENFRCLVIPQVTVDLWRGELPDLESRRSRQ